MNSTSEEQGLVYGYLHGRIKVDFALGQSEKEVDLREGY